MRNLKRALSLAMATFMLLGMMVVGAGAASFDDFSDKDKVVNKEAVSVLNTLGVIAGRDDGNFDPEGVVTRGEMAKMICVVLNGGKDPQLGNITANFADTKGHWAEAYIAYCANLGIIAGVGNGNFEPNATVTGSQAAKMLLVALGYNASVEGYTGANWQINVDVAANQKGLYDELGKVNTTDGLTRDNAAQMVYNALDVKMVEYNYVITGNSDNSLTTKPQVTSGKLGTLMEEKFNAVKVEGIVVANEFANLDSTSAKGSSLDEGKTKISVTNDEDQDTYSGSLTFNTTTGVDELGRAVSLFVKKNSNASKADVLGSVIVSDGNKVVVNASADSIATVAEDNNLDIASGAQVAENYGGLASYSKFNDPKTAGVEKILIDNDNDGDVEIIIVNTYYFGKVTSYVTSGDGSITISTKGDGLTAGKSADVTGFDDVAKNDYVMAAYIGGRLIVEKAESVTGQLEAYKEKNYTNPSEIRSTKLTVDGTDYNVSHIEGYVGGTDNISAGKTYGSANLDNEATFYLDKNGYVVAVGDVAENAYNYALVLAKGTTIDERVKVALPDGSTDTYNFKSSGGSVKFSDIEVGQVYGYSINSNKVIRLTDANQEVVDADNAKFSKGKTTIAADGISSQYANQNTVFFYTSDLTGLNTETGTISDVNIYAGYNKAPSLKDAAGATVDVYTNGTRTVAVVFSGADLTTANVSDNLYLSGVGTSTSSYTNATAFIAGNTEAQSIKTDSKYSTGVYTYKINSDGHYELETAPAGNLVASTSSNQYGVYASNSDNMVIGTGTNYATGRAEYSITAKTLLVNDSSYLDDAFAELGAGPDQGDKISYVIYNSDKEALLIVVKNTKASDLPVLSTDVMVANSDKGNGYAAPTFYRESDVAITLAEKQAALTKVMMEDGCTDISFEGMSKVTYTLNGSRNTTTISSNARAYKLTVDSKTPVYLTVGATHAITGIGTSYKAVANNVTTHAAYGNYTMTAYDTVITTGYVKVAVDGTDKYAVANTSVALDTLDATGNYYTVDNTTYKLVASDKLDLLAADVTVTSGFYKLTVDGVDSYKTEGTSVTMSGVDGEFYTVDGETFTAKATAFDMPAADTVITAGYYSVTVGAATYTIDGVVFNISVPSNSYAQENGKVTATVTVAVGQTPTAGSQTATLTVTGTGASTANGVEVTASDILSLATKVLTTNGTNASTTAGEYTFEITVGTANVEISLA